MRILHTETLKKWGGQQNRVLAEARGLVREGHTVVIACHRGSILAGKAADAGIKVYELNMVKQSHITNIPKLIRIIRAERMEIVATHSSVDSWAGGIAAKLSGRKLVRFRHNLYPIGRDPLTRLIYAMPDKVVAIGDMIGEALEHYGISKQKIAVIRSSVDAAGFDPEGEDLRKEIGIPKEAVVIGNTSTFTKVKGQELLLAAFNEVCGKVPCYLLFAGRLNEESKKKYLPLVDRQYQDRVIFLGHRDDIPRVLRTLDVFVFPSLLEGLGTALLEAMAMKRPVVASDIPTFRNFIEQGSNGVLFSHDEAGDLAEKVVDLIRDEGMRKHLGEKARETIIRKFSLKVMINKTEALYQAVLQA
ncbi:MAG: glycosyltransferase family 4 protein [Nitrospirae bacterium]|nr:glycosyltransferase family 4 protein [Nitrospirota bacterium]